MGDEKKHQRDALPADGAVLRWVWRGFTRAQCFDGDNEVKHEASGQRKKEKFLKRYSYVYVCIYFINKHLFKYTDLHMNILNIFIKLIYIYINIYKINICI